MTNPLGSLKEENGIEAYIFVASLVWHRGEDQQSAVPENASNRWCVSAIGDSLPESSATDELANKSNFAHKYHTFLQLKILA